MYRNQANQKITLFAYVKSTQDKATGIADKLKCYISIDDGPFRPLTDQTATEDDSTNAEGLYTWNLTQAETNGAKLKFSVTSTDPNIETVPIPDLFTKLPPVTPIVDDDDDDTDPSLQPGTIEDLSIVKAGIPVKDGCPILTRIKAFIVQEGVSSTLEYVFRNKKGNPIDIAPTIAVSESLSESAATGDDEILLRIQEFTNAGGSCSPNYAAVGTIVNGAAGVIRAKLPKEVIAQSGIYRLSWGLIRGGELVLTQDGLLSVEKTLFGFDGPFTHTEGPMTINELRMQIMDSSATENNLLDNVEFDDEQIVLAITRPVQYFNETNPPIDLRVTTTNFPWKIMWIEGVLAELYLMAAAKYRRNKLETTDAGITASDMSKEPEYLKIAAYHREQFQGAVLKKKAEINMAACIGIVGSSYGFMYPR